MAGFTNIRDVVDAELNGKTNYATWRKRTGISNTSGVWFDLSMSSGNPVPNYYAATPLTSIALRQSTDGGIRHGGNVSPSQKVLRSFTSFTPSTGTTWMILHDYLMFYPFCDEGDTAEISLIQSATLPRYTDGAGVKIMAVSVAPRTGNQTFRCTYTNQAGVSGRITQTVTQNSAGANGSIVTSSTTTQGCYIPLQAGDTGVRSIESYQMISGTDVGLFALVLVKPLAQTVVREQTAAVEKDYLLDHGLMPVIQDDAYLNLVAYPTVSLSSVDILGDIKVVWN
jgi:hypothetical protein